MNLLGRSLLLASLALVQGPLPAQAAAAKPERIEIVDLHGAKLAFPVEGQALRVRSTKGQQAATLRVTYRPGSKVAETVDVANPEHGVFSWMPTLPGLAKLEVLPADKSAKPLESRTVSVRFAQTSVLGLVIMIFAACLLFGGAAFSIRVLMRSSPD